MLFAPLAAAGSRMRRSRVLHPSGVLYAGIVRGVANEAPWTSLAGRLAGHALVRLSGALWRGHEWPDVLGCAMRLRDAGAPEETAGAADQDLLFATARSSITLVPSVLTTDQHDFLRNEYYAIGLFETPETGLIQLRLAPTPGGLLYGTRGERLDERVRRGLAVLYVEARPRQRGAGWERVAELQLIAPAKADERGLRFSPENAGRGIEARGLLQAMRRAPYRASQAARARAA